MPDASSAALDEALATVAAGRDLRAVLAALEALRGEVADGPRVREALLARYAHLAENGPRRDGGALVRAAIVRALRGKLMAADLPFLERGTAFYETTRGVEVAAPLRAACLAALDDLDEARALDHATRLLLDAGGADPTPDSVVTAIRLLAARGAHRPLYLFVLQGATHPAVLAEALRALAGVLPAALVPSVVARWAESPDEAVGVGLLELLVEHPARASFAELVVERLRATRSPHVFHFGAAAVVASRAAPLVAGLLELAGAETDPTRRAVLAELLAPRAHDPAVRDVLDRLAAPPGRRPTR